MFRMIPPLRGRVRIENIFHRLIEDRMLEDDIRVNGYDLEVSLDDLIGRSIYLNGVWERENTAAIKRILVPGSVVFDVGANIGYYALLFATLCGSSGHVYAFEPVLSTLAIIKRNLARNMPMAANVELIEVALSDIEGSVKVNVTGGRNLGASHVVSAHVDDPGRARAGVVDTITIRCRTADAVWKELGCPQVDLVKMDIEGHEYHAIRGMRELIEASPAISLFIEIRHSYLVGAGSSAEEIFAYLRDLGLHVYDFDYRAGRFLRNSVTRSGELILFSKRDLD